MTEQRRVNILIIAFVALASVANAFAYRLAVDKSDEKPLVDERLSNSGGGGANNESVAQREVINHVHHKHEQTIGNVHILTNIDIANLITILNGSTPTSTSPQQQQQQQQFGGQPTDATAMSPTITTSMTIVPGKCFKRTNKQTKKSIYSNHKFILDFIINTV